jgi:hypothetical protein
MEHGWREELRHIRAETNMDLRWRAGLFASDEPARSDLARIAVRRGWAVSGKVYADLSELLVDAEAGLMEVMLMNLHGRPWMSPVNFPFERLLPYKRNFRRAGSKGSIQGHGQTIRRVADEEIRAKGPRTSGEIADALFERGLAEGSHLSVKAFVRLALSEDAEHFIVGPSLGRDKAGRWSLCECKRDDIAN